MTDETIQQDVSAEAKAENAEVSQPTQAADESPRFEGPMGRRERKMAELAEKAREEREAGRKAAALMNNPDLTEEEYDAEQVAAASRGGRGTEAQLEDAAEDDDSAAGVAEEPKAKREMPAGFVDRGDGTPVKRLKVNGQIVELTEQEYERQLSKDLAGDAKLRMVAERERKLAEREAELQRREQASRQPPPAEPGANAVDIDAALKEYLDAVYAGDPDAAASKLKEVIQTGRQSSTPNMDDIVSTVATRVKEEAAAERHREAVNRGWAQFQREFSDIATNPKLLAYADTVIKEVYAENPELPADELIIEAGRRTAEELKLRTGESVEPRKADAGSRDARLERKAQLKPVPRVASAQAPREKTPEPPKTAAEKIAAMRAARAL